MIKLGSPSIILTSQFTTPDAKSFSSYLKYMTRKNALSQKNISRENDEIKRIETVIERYDMRGKTFSSLNNKETLSEKEVEANFILNSNSLLFNSSEVDYEKYIAYMSRQYALEKKKNKTDDELKELKVIKDKISDFIKVEQDITERPGFIPGVFSIDKEKMTREDIKNVHKIIHNAQQNGSVFYQDVISFDTEFLIKEGIYNPENNELDEQRIQQASRKMMEKMFKDEEIESGYWFASIHRNTEHIHIHFGTVEARNTRPLIKVKDETTGIEYLAPKGKRKQSTLDNMKSIFANALVDRTAELSRISELRNTLVSEIKKYFSQNREDLEQTKLLQEIYMELPSNKKYWQYGSRHMPEKTRRKIDLITKSLMKDNPDYQEYISLIEKESVYRKELFGESQRKEKDYAQNQMKDIQKRLGNSLLKEIKKHVNTLEMYRNKYENRETNGIQEKDKNFGHKNTKLIEKKRYYIKPLLNSKNLYQIKKALFCDYEKYRAQKDYEYLQQKIAMEQERNSL